MDDKILSYRLKAIRWLAIICLLYTLMYSVCILKKQNDNIQEQLTSIQSSLVIEKKEENK